MPSPLAHPPEEKKVNAVSRRRSRSRTCSNGLRLFQVVQPPAEIFGEEELTEEEKLEQEQAARSIQVCFLVHIYPHADLSSFRLGEIPWSESSQEHQS